MTTELRFISISSVLVLNDATYLVGLTADGRLYWTCFANPTGWTPMPMHIQEQPHD